MADIVPGPSSFNPFHELSSALGKFSSRSKEAQAHQQAMMSIAAQHQALTEHTVLSHTLGEVAKQSEFTREQKRHRMQMSGRFKTMKLGAELARGGGQVSAGDVSVSLPKPTTAPAAEVKKPRSPRVRARGNY